MTLAAEKHSFVGGPFGSNLQSKDYTQSGVMIIQLNNIGEGLFSTEKRKFTSTQKADELLSCNAYPGDIIVSKMMPAGRACILPDLYSRYVMGSDAIRVKVDGEKYSNTFICAQINTTRCHKWIDGRTGGSTRQRIGLPVLKELPLYFPTIAEQKTISFFLNLLDKRIQTQNKIIRDLESQIVAINNRFFDSLQSVALFHDLYEYAGEGGTPDTKERDYYEPQEIPFIKIENLYEKYLRSHSAHISEIGLRNSSAWLVPAQCVLLSNGATIGECTITTYPVCTKQGILGIVPSSQTSAEFLYLLFKSRCFKRKLRCITTKGTMDAVYLKDMNQMIVPFCNQKEQQRHIGAMKPFEEKLEMEKRLLFCLKKEKEYLLRNLFI